MVDIYLDTNFLMLPYTRKIDIFSEIDRIIRSSYRLLLVPGTLEELEKLCQTEKGEHRRAAKMALAIAKAKNIPVLDSKQKDLYMANNSKKPIVDDIILALAQKDVIVATQDKELKKAVKEKGAGVIFAKKGKLEIENVL
jgi:rRNA-processing protein FCF1